MTHAAWGGWIGAAAGAVAYYETAVRGDMAAGVVAGLAAFALWVAAVIVVAQSKMWKEKIAEFCRRWKVSKLEVFGSVLRDDFRPDSDIDVLVEFEPEARTGFAFFGMQEELSAILGRNVDLNTAGFLSKYFRDEVLREAQVLYDAA